MTDTLGGRTADIFAGSGLLAADAPRTGLARLRTRCGRTLPFDAEGWHGPASAEEIAVLRRVRGPVIDVACGPGRLVRHLVDRGVVAVGVDAAPDAVAAARTRGVPVVLADVWQDLPREGSWDTVLLFDGNIGIGAAPAALLERCARLLGAGGGIIVEVGSPASATGIVEARIEWSGWRSPWFDWATVSLSDLTGVAAAAGLGLRWVEVRRGRCFARLERPRTAGTDRREQVRRTETSTTSEDDDEEAAA